MSKNRDQQNRKKHITDGRRTIRYSFLLAALILLAGFPCGEQADASASEKLTVQISIVKVKKVKLTWNEIQGAASYLVYRSTQPEGPYESIGSVKGSTLHFVDQNLARGTTGYYKVRAIGSTQDQGEKIISKRVHIYLSGKPLKPELTVTQKKENLHFHVTGLYGVERAYLYYRLPGGKWQLMNISKKSYAWYPTKEKEDHFRIEVSAGGGKVAFYLVPYGRAQGSYIQGKKSNICKLDVKEE